MIWRIAIACLLPVAALADVTADGSRLEVRTPELAMTFAGYGMFIVTVQVLVPDTETLRL